MYANATLISKELDHIGPLTSLLLTTCKYVQVGHLLPLLLSCSYLCLLSRIVPNDHELNIEGDLWVKPFPILCNVMDQVL